MAKRTNLYKFIFLIGIGFIFARAGGEFFQIAWGTGSWLGEFSLKWGAAFFLFILLSILSLTISGVVLWNERMRLEISARLVSLRERAGILRWIILAVIILTPAWFFQYTPWGVVFQGLYFRIVVWLYVLCTASILLAKDHQAFGWVPLFSALILTASVFIITLALINVTDYPFSITWSEGNRLWDYSMLFARHLYDYPLDAPVHQLIDIGRQFVGGIPFLIPRITIRGVRLWLALMQVIPYLLAGWAAFYLKNGSRGAWFLGGLWAFSFLQLGPIHAPLVLYAFIIALLWGRPLWLGLPLVALTSYVASESRFTWLFAPGMWIGMLELGSAVLNGSRLRRSDWTRPVLLGLSGVLGGYVIPNLESLLQENVPAGVSVSSVSISVSSQPLLWYRLLPNSTYGHGILLGLLYATGPLIAVLLYLLSTKRWLMNVWQKLAVLCCLMAFLIVGLVASTKIGGGGDLHNMDMFLIGLMFAAALAWRNGGREWIQSIYASPLWTRVLTALMLAYPGLYPLSAIYPYGFAEELPWLRVLTDAPREDMLDMYPPDDVVNEALGVIQAEVSQARQTGGVLFIDQRQLLTFGYIRDVPLIPEYEKKILMNEALGRSDSYFEEFYARLGSKQYSLIITEPLKTPIKDIDFRFGEENNAWVKRVAVPLLCYYEVKETLKEVNVQLLIPRVGPVDCSAQLP